MEFIRADELDKIPALIDMAMAINQADPNKRIQVIDGEVFCKGVPVPKVLSDKIIKFQKEKLPIEIFLRFWENLTNNPSESSKKQLFGFLESSHFPLTPDGHIIAYKSVDANFKDGYTGKMDNSPGAVVKMPRNNVDANPNKTCSHGLHVASYKYAKHSYGGAVLLEVKVNPADIVAIPTDYNQGKCRCCEYTVIGPINSEHKVEVVPKKVPATAPAKKAARKKVVDTVDAVAKSKSKQSGVPAHLENIQIGPYPYKAAGVSQEALELASKKGYKRVKPSKLPAALKQIGTVQVFRKALTKTKYDYYLETKDGQSETRTVFLRYQQMKIKK